MSPQPKSSAVAPFRWLACVILDPADVNGLLKALPEESALSKQLRDSALAEKWAARLNRVDLEGEGCNLTETNKTNTNHATS
jgi:hypothetical protein